MMQNFSRIWLLVCLMPMHSAFSAGIQNLTFTEVVKDCIIINAATKAETPAKAGDVLTPPNVLKTGADSRAELVAEDKTVTRVGANTIFSVEADSRDVNIAQGSVLFASPKGRGGGRIKSAGATASVLGTTMIVGANQAGGFKVMLLEGKGEVKGLKGGGVILNPGQLSFALPGQAPSAPMSFELKGQVGGSKLVKGFSKPLASIGKIEAAISGQNIKISMGALTSTGLLLTDRPEAAFRISLSAEKIAQKIKDSIEQVIIKPVNPNDLTDSLAKTDPNADAIKNDKVKVTEIINDAFTAAISKTLPLTDSSVPVTSKNPAPNPDGDTAFDWILKIDGSGLSSRGKIPKSIPGDRATGGVNLAVFAKDIDINLSLYQNEVSATSPLLLSPVGKAYFVNETTGEVTFVDPAGLDANVGNVNRTSFVALNDLTISKSVDFADNEHVFRVSADGTVSLVDSLDLTKTDQILSTPLILSAGHSLKIAKGSLVRAATSLFEISVAGTGYSSDINLSEKSVATKEPLSLDSVSLLNPWPLESDVPMGITRIKAPAISLRNTAVTSGEIILESAGAISATRVGVQGTITTNNGVSKVTFASSTSLEGMAEGQSVVAEGIAEGTTIQAIDTQNKTITLSKQATSNTASTPVYNLVPLGVNRPQDLAFMGPKVSFTSSGSSLSLTDVYFVTDDGLLSAAEGLTISGVSVASMDFQTDQSFTATAGGNLSVSDSEFSALVTGVMNSSKGSVSLWNSVFGSAGQDVDTLDETTEPKTSFTSSSKTDMLVKDTQIYADKVALTSGESIEISGAKLAQTDSLKSEFKATAAKSVTIKDSTTISALTTSILAGVDILLKQSVIQAPQSNLPGSVFWAQATTGSISIQYGVVDASNVTLTAAGNVTIEGITTTNGLSKSAITANLVNIVSKTGDITVKDTTFYRRTKPDDTATLNISMWAANQILLNNTNLSNAAVTTLDAATVVLKDVSFKDGSSVNLNSSQGLVAARPGTSGDFASAVRGQVNILTGVKYGPTTIALPNQSAPMNNTAFKDAVNTTLGINRDAFTIGTHTPAPPATPARP